MAVFGDKIVINSAYFRNDVSFYITFVQTYRLSLKKTVSIIWSFNDNDCEAPVHCKVQDE